MNGRNRLHNNCADPKSCRKLCVKISADFNSSLDVTASHLANCHQPCVAQRSLSTHGPSLSDPWFGLCMPKQYQDERCFPAQPGNTNSNS